jgi:hypothetical protein
MVLCKSNLNIIREKCEIRLDQAITAFLKEQLNIIFGIDPVKDLCFWEQNIKNSFVPLTNQNNSLFAEELENAEPIESDFFWNWNNTNNVAFEPEISNTNKNLNVNISLPKLCSQYIVNGVHN